MSSRAAVRAKKDKRKIVAFVRIAYVFYEYPPDTAYGGIATYTEQAARMMRERGHQVEVFSGSKTRNITETINGVEVHRCLFTTVKDFVEVCLQKFCERHEANSFDLVESPEIFAMAFPIKEKYPTLPLVVKLHMASFIQMRLLNFYTPWLTKLRFFLGGLKRGRIHIYGDYRYEKDIEYRFTALADGIVAPSFAQKKLTQREWHLPAERITVIPNPFTPPEQLLRIPIGKLNQKRITFIGKLNVHKGVVNLAKAVPLVVEKHPDAVFQFIGGDGLFPVGKMMMSEYIKKLLRGFEQNYVISGVLEYKAVLEQLEDTSLCVFPSLWECFGIVCLEAMSAGRPVIGSREGGMNEILENSKGVVVNPHKPKEIADAINAMLDDEGMRKHYGEAGRLSVLEKYNEHAVGELMEQHYRETIQKTTEKYHASYRPVGNF